MPPATAWRRRGESFSQRNASPTRPRASSIERLSPEPRPATAAHAHAHAHALALALAPVSSTRSTRDSQANGQTLQGLGLGLSHTTLHDGARGEADHLYLDADGRAHLGATRAATQDRDADHSQPPARRANARATATQYRGPPKRAHTRTGSTIDDLANVAIATSPPFTSHPTFPFGASPTFRATARPSTSYINGYSQDSFERPAKRIKSERLYSQEWSLLEERPRSSDTYSPEVRKEDAELLLCLQNDFRFSPSQRPAPPGDNDKAHASNSQLLQPRLEPGLAARHSHQRVTDRSRSHEPDPSARQPEAEPAPCEDRPPRPAIQAGGVKQQQVETGDEGAHSPSSKATAKLPPDGDEDKPPNPRRFPAATGTTAPDGPHADVPTRQDPPEGSKRARRVAVQTQPVCPMCHQMQYRGREGETTIDWIKCEASCHRWFHIPCAGFSDAEVKKVAKFICPECEPTHGKTTYARTSSRARAAPDYAALNEGVMKTAEDTTVHHFVSQFKDGAIAYHPDDFARVRPELLTKAFWANMDGMKRPFVVPACWNPRFGQTADPPGSDAAAWADEPTRPIRTSEGHLVAPDSELAAATRQALSSDPDAVVDVDQDYLDMIMPRNLTVRKVAELYGPDEPVPVIEVKTQETRGRFTLRQWANYYEETGVKPIRNVISLEVSHSRLGRLIRRPKVVRDIDLEPQVWDPASRAASKSRPIAFYCLMSVGDSYTDFHIDFGGSSVYYHILTGQKTFFFIPPEERYLKKYEEWSNSPQQNDTWLPDLCGGNVTRIDLHPGDTAFIPAGWIHSVWTPCDSLVIGGNFLTRYDLDAQIKVTQIEKATHVAPSFRYPFFQKVMWYTLINYLDEDPVPEAVIHDFQEDPDYRYLRAVPVYEEPEVRAYEEEPDDGEYNARTYTKSELRGLPALRDYLYRTARIYADLPVDNINKRQIDAVKASVPKGHGDPLQLICLFAVWVAWKLGNVTVPDWVHSDSILQQELDKRDKDKAKKPEVFRVPPERVSARRKHQASPAPPASERQDTPDTRESASPSDTSSHLPYPRIACESCRKKRQKCQHLPGSQLEETAQQTLEKTRSYSNVTIDIAKLARASPVVASVDSGPSTTPPHASVTPVAPTTVADEILLEPPVQADLAQAARARMTSQPPEATGMTINGIPPTPGSAKKGRSKACDECRKSKRRCVHDEHGRVDPAKAAEPSKPRGSASGKRPARISDEHQHKKVKSEASTDSDYAVFAPPPPDLDAMIDPALMGPIDPMLALPYPDSGMMVLDGNTISTPPHPWPADHSLVPSNGPVPAAIDPNIDPALMDGGGPTASGDQGQPVDPSAPLQPSALRTLNVAPVGTPDLDKSYSPITTGSAEAPSKHDSGEENQNVANGADSPQPCDHAPVDGAPPSAAAVDSAVTNETARQARANTDPSSKEQLVSTTSRPSSDPASAVTPHDATAVEWSTLSRRQQTPQPDTSPKGKGEKPATTPAPAFARADTVASGTSDPELDASEKLARELQAQEHGLRRRPSVRIS